MECAGGPAKLCLDLAGDLGCRRDMDEDDEELLVLLCTRIGVIMEDASFVALTIRGTHGAERNAVIAQIATATEILAALTGAVSALILART